MPTVKPSPHTQKAPLSGLHYALEELRQARHKRQRSLQFFIVPRLMSPEWNTQLYKASDVIFSLPAGHPNWLLPNHEPLTVAIFFPYIYRAPWELKGTPLMGRMARELCDLFKKDPGTGRYILSQLLKISARLDHLSIQQLRRVLSGQWFPRLSDQQTTE